MYSYVRKNTYDYSTSTYENNMRPKSVDVRTNTV